MVAFIPTLAAVGSLLIEPTTTVDPAAVPAGTELHVLVDGDGRPISAPRLDCPSPLGAWRGDEVQEVCEGAVAESRAWVVGSTAVATVAWVILVTVRRRRRGRSAELVDPGHPSATPTS
jgi:hypothetical protein